MSAGAVGTSGADVPEGGVWHGWGDPRRRTGLGPVGGSAQRFLHREVGLPRDIAPRLPVALEQVRLPAPALPDGLRERLAGVADVRDNALSRITHAGGKSYLDLVRRRAGDASEAPDAVVLPADAAAVAAVLALCAAASVAVVPFGGGTSVVGGVEPLRGRFSAVIALDLTRLDQLLALDEESQTATLQPGLRGPQAEALLGARGWTLGHLPQSFEYATVGGWIATRSAGQASSGYGRSDDLVVAMRIATPAGELVLGRAPRSAAGPDLRQLLIGSEGAFGVITEVTLAVRRLPEVHRYEGWFFRSFVAGCEAFRTLAQEGVAADVCRLSDEDETRSQLALSSHDTGMTAAYLRLRRLSSFAVLGWEGTESSVRRRRAATVGVLRAAGGVPVGQGSGRSWREGRFAAPYLRDDMLDAGLLVETLETAATWHRLPAVHAAVRSALTRSLQAGGGTPLVLTHVSHLYRTGASLYVTVIDRQWEGTDAAVAQWQAAKRAATDALLDAGGTLTHHHAVGTDHAPWLSREVGDLGVEVLRAVKTALDPDGILNPGKLLP